MASRNHVRAETNVRATSAPVPRAERRASPMRQVVRWIAARELLWLALLTPILLFPTSVPKWLAAGALVGVAGLWMVRWLALGSPVVPNAFNPLLLFFLLTLLPGMYATVDLYTSVPKIIGIILGVTVFAAIVQTMQAEGRIRLAAWGLYLAGLGVAVVGLVGTDWTAKVPQFAALYQRLPRFISSVPYYLENKGLHPNEVGGTLLLFIPLALGLALGAQSRRTRVVLGLGALIPIGVLLLTVSRGALLGLAVALGCWGALRNKWLRGLALLGLVAAIASVVVIGVEPLGNLLSDSGGPGATTLDLAGRMEIWSRAVYILQDFPYTGIGFNMFAQVVNVLYPLFLIGPDAQIPHAHNNLLQTGVEQGMPGLVAYVGLMTVFGILAARLMLGSEKREARMVAAGLFFGLLAHELHGLVDAITLASKPAIFIWAMFGLVAAMWVSYTQPAPSPLGQGSRPSSSPLSTGSHPSSSSLSKGSRPSSSPLSKGGGGG